MLLSPSQTVCTPRPLSVTTATGAGHLFLSLLHPGLQTVGIFRVGSSKKRVRQVSLLLIESYSVSTDNPHSTMLSLPAANQRPVFALHTFPNNKQNLLSKNQLCDHQRVAVKCAVRAREASSVASLPCKQVDKPPAWYRNTHRANQHSWLYVSQANVFLKYHHELFHTLLHLLTCQLWLQWINTQARVKLWVSISVGSIHLYIIFPLVCFHNTDFHLELLQFIRDVHSTAGTSTTVLPSGTCPCILI